jgi:hypothetical protein
LLPKGNSRELTDVVSTEVVSTEVVSTEVVFTTRFATNTCFAFRALRLPTVHLNLHSLDGQIAWGARSLIFVRLNGVTEISGTTPWVSRGIDPEENDKRPLGSFGRVASRMNCRYRAPVPFTPLVATVLLASQSIGSRCDARKPRTRPFSPDSSGRDQRLDQHRFRSLGKLVVGNLDRIADVDNVGN